MAQQNRIPDIKTAMGRLAADTIFSDDGRSFKVTSPERPRKMALVLSGGGASGAFEAGVIEETVKAMEQHNSDHPDNPLHFDAVIGTSTGALNGCGILLDHLFGRGLLKEAAWLKKPAGHTLNHRLWHHLASCKRPSRFVIDKSWLLALIQGAGRRSRFLIWAALLLLAPILLLAAFLLPDLLGSSGFAIASPVIGWLAAGAALLLPTGITLTLWKQKGLLQRSGRPLFSAALFLLPALFALGWLQNSLTALITTHPYNVLAGYGFTLLFLPLLFILTALSISGDALFGNSRLKRILAALGDPNSKTAKLRSPVSRSKAEDYGRAISRTIHEAYEKAKEPTLPAFLFTATNITAEKQGLFLLGSDEDTARLASGHWLPLPFRKEKEKPGVDPEDILRGVIASTAIPATYPPEIVAYQHEGSRRHIFVDGGVLDFAAYHAAIDLGCTHIVAVETDALHHNLMDKQCTTNWINLLSNAAATSFTGSNEEAREEAARIAATNRRVAFEGLDRKRLILFYRIAPSDNERMINGDEFNGRFKDGKRVCSLADWIEYGKRVNPDAGRLPESIWYRGPDGSWQENLAVQGPLILDASFSPDSGR